MHTTTNTQTNNLRKILIEIISYAFILLFIYAALYKLFDIHYFERQLAKSPLIVDFSHFLSYSVPLTELTLAVLILIPKTRWYGLVGGTALMLSFTLYITYILNFSPQLPCSCGGILATMGWRDHLIFNSLYVAAGITALWLMHRNPK